MLQMVFTFTESLKENGNVYHPGSMFSSEQKTNLLLSQALYFVDIFLYISQITYFQMHPNIHNSNSFHLGSSSYQCHE